MKTKKAILLLSSLLFTLMLPGQVQVFLHQPPPGQLNIADLWKFEVVNNSEVSRYVKFHATVSSENEGLVFEGTSAAYELSSMFSGLVSFPELEPFDMAYVDEGIKGILIQTGTVPSGVYIICIEVFDLESSLSLFRDCIEQEVIQASPPVLIYPVDGSAMEEELPVFSWMEPVPPIQGVTYKIRINEVVAGQSPEQALISNPPYFEYTGIDAPIFEYPLSARPMEQGKTYAWRVSAMIAGRPLVESEYATFLRLGTGGGPGEIELTYPAEGALINPAKDVLCWKPLQGDDIVYNVFVATDECDSSLMDSDGGHPFGYLGPDPASRRADSIRRDIQENQLPYWRAICERLGENIDIAVRNRGIFRDQQRQFEEWAEEVGCELTEPDCHLPDCCPDEGCCAGLDPSDPDDRAEFRRRIGCLTGPMSSMNDMLNEFADDFEWLIDRWRRGEEHRNVMGVYDEVFGAMEYLFSMQWLEDIGNEIMDALGISEFMDELRNFVLRQVCAGLQYSDEECQGVIRQLDELEQLMNDVKEGKENVETFRDALKALKNGGEMPFEVFLKLMENLYAAAGEATGTAVSGWENYRREMCETLQRAYNLNRCLQELNDEIIKLGEDCPEFCRGVIPALEEEAREAAGEYQRLREERQERWRQDSTEFVNDLDKAILECIGIMGDAGICCQDGQGRQVYTFPPYSSGDPCKEYIYGLLGRHLGERMCYFNIRIEVDCENLEVSYEWETTEGFQRNEDCCPPTGREELVGRTEASEGDDEVCWPPGGDQGDPGREGLDTDGPGRWRVEAERDGRVIARSPSRGFTTAPRGETPPPDTIRIPRTPGGKCNCSVQISPNGFNLPPGTGMLIEKGTKLNIQMQGGCSGSCSPAGQRISIKKPLLVFLGMGWANAAVNVNGNQANYSFDATGTYRIVAIQQCSDGSECRAEAVVEVKKPDRKADKARITEFKDRDMQKCGNSKCMHPYYYKGQDQVFIQANEVAYDDPGVEKIGYLSECFPRCPGDRQVEWQITAPDGRYDLLDGANLFEIDYDFGTKGIYSICIVETADCPDGKRKESKYLIVKSGM